MKPSTIGLASFLAATIGITAFAIYRQSSRRSEVDVQFLMDAHPVVLRNTGSRELLVFPNTKPADIVARIGDRWSGEGWKPVEHGDTDGGETYVWTNLGKHLRIQLSTGAVADLNAAMVAHQRLSPTDVLVDVMR